MREKKRVGSTYKIGKCDYIMKKMENNEEQRNLRSKETVLICLERERREENGKQGSVERCIKKRGKCDLVVR